MEHMNFTWATPLRRTGSRLLPVIPNEIYIVILDSFIPSSRFANADELKSLRSFAAVCRFFCHLALPKLFARVVFDGSDPENNATSSGHRMTTWARAILAGERPALTTASFVKEVVFRDWAWESQPQSQSDPTTFSMRSWLIPFAVLHCKAIAHGMANVEGVVFMGTTITPHHVRALRALPNLRNLAFRGRTRWSNAGSTTIYGLAEGLEYVMIEGQAWALPDWAWKSLAACPSLRSVAVEGIRMISRLGSCLQAEADPGARNISPNERPAHGVNELHVRMPPLYSSLSFLPDVFRCADEWARFFPGLERLRISVKPELTEDAFMERAQLAIEDFARGVTDKLPSLRVLEVDAEDAEKLAKFEPVQPELDDRMDHSLQRLSNAVGAELHYVAHGSLEWRLESGRWRQGRRSTTSTHIHPYARFCPRD